MNEFMKNGWVVRTLEDLAEMDDVEDVLDLYELTWAEAGPGPVYTNNPGMDEKGYNYLFRVRAFLLNEMANKHAELVA